MDRASGSLRIFYECQKGNKGKSKKNLFFNNFYMNGLS